MPKVSSVPSSVKFSKRSSTGMRGQLSKTKLLALIFGTTLSVLSSASANAVSCALVTQNGIACVQTASKLITASSGTIAFPSNIAAHNLIVVVVKSAGGDTSLPSDTLGNIYLSNSSLVNLLKGSNRLSIYYAEDSKAGANTVTVSTTGASAIRVAIFEYSGLATAGALDQAAGATGSSTTPASPTVTTTAAPELVVGGLETASAGTIVSGTGYSLEQCRESCSSGSLGTEDQILSGNASLAATWTIGGSLAWASMIATFRTGAPTTYSARTDQCETSGTGTESGCTGQLPMAFLGRNNSVGQVFTPSDVPPTLGTPLDGKDPVTHLSVTAIDQDFHTKICRGTDYAHMSSVGSGFNTGSGGDVQNWAADSSAYIVYTSGGGQPIMIAFDQSNCNSTLTQIGQISVAGDCTVGAPYFGSGCKKFVTGNISFSPSLPGVMYELDLGSAPTHLYLNQLTLNTTGSPTSWTFKRELLYDFESSSHCLPVDFAASYVGSFNVSADSSTFSFALGDNGQNGDRNFKVTGTATSGTLQKSESIVQSTTGATSTVTTVGSPLIIGAYQGTPDNSHPWVGQTSGAVFTPSALPVLNKYGATFVATHKTTSPGCRVLKTFGPGHDGYGPMQVDGDWGVTGDVVMGTDKQSITCNVDNQGQMPPCYPNSLQIDHSGGPTLLDTLSLHNAGPTNDPHYVVFSGSKINACTTIGGRSTCYCAGPNLCEAYTWEDATLNVRPNLPEGHNVRGTLGSYRGNNYAFFFYSDPYIKKDNLLTSVSIPVDQHGASGNLNSQDQQPIAFSSAQACGTGQGPGNQACDPDYGIIGPAIGNYPYYDEFVAIQNQAAHPNDPDYKSCDYGSGPNTAACAYRFAHTFNSGTNWNFSAQNAIANISPNGKWALVATDWFTNFGCTNGFDGVSSGQLCLNNVDANGKGTPWPITSATQSGTTITFVTDQNPTLGSKQTVTDFMTETRYNRVWTVVGSGAHSWTTTFATTGLWPDSNGKSHSDCGNGALASTPCPRSDVVVIDLLSAGTAH